MVVERITRRVDDLNGEVIDDDSQPIVFAFDGATFEIDLSQPNVEQFRRILAPYLEAGRRVPRRGARALQPKARPRRDPSEVREWARANGYSPSERGRISSEIVDAYQAAQTSS